MDAYISSSLDAYILLQQLEESAKGMTIDGISVTGDLQRRLTRKRSLRLTKTVGDQRTVVTISRHNPRTLVASLENKETLVEATVKERLAALLIPLVNEFVASNNATIRTDGRVRIVFGEIAGKPRPGKTCVLFAEDAAIHQAQGSSQTKPCFPAPSNRSHAIA